MYSFSVQWTFSVLFWLREDEKYSVFIYLRMQTVFQGKWKMIEHDWTWGLSASHPRKEVVYEWGVVHICIDRDCEEHFLAQQYSILYNMQC